VPAGGFIDLKKLSADDVRVRLSYREDFGSGSSKGFGIATDSDGGTWSGIWRFFVLDTGLVGVGTGDPKVKLDVNGTLRIGDGTEWCNSVDHEGAIKYSAVDDEFYVCRNSTAGWEPIGSGGGGIWSDSGNGYLEYTATDTGVKLESIVGMAQPTLGLASGLAWDTATSTLVVTGDITYTGTLTDISDRRLKTDIESLVKYGSMLDKIKAIDTYAFHMKDNTEAAKEFGVMAQELEKIFPNLVRTADDERGTKSVNYMGLIAPMIEALKEESAARLVADGKIEKLEEQVALLNRINGDHAEKASSQGLLVYLLVFSLGFLFCIVVRRKAAR
jgi:hypothetical protein